MKFYKISVFIISMLFLSKNVQGQSCYTYSFEDSLCNSYIVFDTSQTNIWQIGEPEKYYFDTAVNYPDHAVYSFPNVMITDTVNAYPVNNHSEFVIPIFDSWAVTPYYDIGFYYKIDTDTLKDGGYILISRDSGVTWTNIYYDLYTTTNGLSGTQTLFNGAVGLSGTKVNGSANGFEPFLFNIYVPNPQTTTFLKFVFVSDSIFDNKEGWMIDNIYINPVLPENIGSYESAKFEIFPNPVNDELSLHLPETFYVSKIEISDQLGRIIVSMAETSVISDKIDVSDMNPGIYNLTLFSKDSKKRLSKRFIKI